MEPADFNIPQELPVGLGMGKLKYEEFAVFALKRHITENIQFNIPIKYKFNHDDMVPRWLTKHGDNEYTLTKKSLGLLWVKYGKEVQHGTV